MSEPLQVLLAPAGSAGDVQPFLTLGRALAERGHRVLALVNPHFEDMARAAGLRPVPVGDAADYRAMIEDPGLWHPDRALRTFGRLVARQSEELYERVTTCARRRPSVAVAAGAAFGARLAREVAGVPLVTVHLQPYCFRSLHEPPVLHPLTGWLGGAPRAVKRLAYRVADGLADRAFAGPLNRLRARLGLAPITRVLAEWWNSPDRILGLFPDWFAPPQPDWPPRARLTGFLRSASPAGISPGLESFLAAGPPPVAFTAGTGMVHGRGFFRAAVKACQRLGARGLLLTKHRGQVPATLPEGVRHEDFVPFDSLLPRCAALVHHGGVGTLAEGLAAGVPQVVCPRAWDQFDNARRVERLGAGHTVRPGTLTGRGLARALERARQPRVRERCRELAPAVATSARPADACRAVEELGRHESSSPVASSSDTQPSRKA